MVRRNRKTRCVLLVEQNVLFRQALALTIDRESSYDVIAQVGSLTEARRAFDGADLAVIDPDLPDGDGTVLIGELHAAYPHCKAVILTASLDARDYVRAADAGASAVLHQSSSLADFVDGLRRVMADDWVLSSRVAGGLLHLAAEQREQERTAGEALSRLTAREHAVFMALAEGLSDQDIAQRLAISIKMERTYLATIQSKLGVRSRLQTLVFATRHATDQNEAATIRVREKSTRRDGRGVVG